MKELSAIICSCVLLFFLGALIGQDVTEKNLTPAQKDIITTKMIILQGDDGRLAQAFYHSKHGFIVQLINSDEEVLHTYKIGK